MDDKQADDIIHILNDEVRCAACGDWFKPEHDNQHTCDSKGCYDTYYDEYLNIMKQIDIDR
jgi:hypothetical protein